MDTMVLWHHLQTINCQFWPCIPSTSWWEWIVLGTWGDEQWLQIFRMHWVTFLHIVAQLALHITCQNISIWPSLTHVANTSLLLEALAPHSGMQSRPMKPWPTIS